VTDQYALRQHVVVLCRELRPDQDELADQLNGRLPHRRRLIEETIVHAHLHVSLQAYTHAHMQVMRMLCDVCIQ
jgi:hypothetical protein